MNAEEHIKAGQLDEALSQAQEAVRKSPAEARPRILPFQLINVRRRKVCSRPEESETSARCRQGGELS
jgi:hypothetical protein